LYINLGKKSGAQKKEQATGGQPEKINALDKEKSQAGARNNVLIHYLSTQM
jgi:hypothetical protein